MTRLSDIYSNFMLGLDYVKVSDVKAYNVQGGTFTQDAWRTRDINTEDSDASAICSIASNQITLEAGTYICDIRAQAYQANRNMLNLYNITAAEITLLGEQRYGGAIAVTTHAMLSGKFTIAVQTTFEVRHYCIATNATDGFGLESFVSGIDSIFTVAEFIRIKDLSQTFNEMADYVKVSDVKATNTVGGTFTQAAWRTRVINTEDSDVSAICSVSSNQITLEAGTYVCSILCPCYAVNNSKARLYDITNSATILLGQHNMAHPTNGGSFMAPINGKFTLAAQTVLEIQHWCVATVADIGFGTASNIDSTSEVFTVAEFWRVAT